MWPKSSVTPLKIKLARVVFTSFTVDEYVRPVVSTIASDEMPLSVRVLNFSGLCRCRLGGAFLVEIWNPLGDGLSYPWTTFEPSVIQ